MRRPYQTRYYPRFRLQKANHCNDDEITSASMLKKIMHYHIFARRGLFSLDVAFVWVMSVYKVVTFSFVFVNMQYLLFSLKISLLIILIKTTLIISIIRSGVDLYVTMLLPTGPFPALIMVKRRSTVSLVVMGDKYNWCAKSWYARIEKKSCQQVLNDKLRQPWPPGFDVRSGYNVSMSNQKVNQDNKSIIVSSLPGYYLWLTVLSLHFFSEPYIFQFHLFSLISSIWYLHVHRR